MPLPLSAGKQQTRELLPSKIITITNNTYNYQRREVDGQWGLMEQSNGTPNIVSMGHAVTITTINGTIHYHMSMGHNNIQLIKQINFQKNMHYAAQSRNLKILGVTNRV